MFNINRIGIAAAVAFIVRLIVATIWVGMGTVTLRGFLAVLIDITIEAYLIGVIFAFTYNFLEKKNEG